MTVRELITIAKLPFRKDRELYHSIRHILGFWPLRISFYREALQHKSLREKNERGCRVNNERLEFLGDAVLGLVVADIVYRHFPNKPEGFLTSTRSKLVQRSSLNRIAEEMGLSKLIQSRPHTQNAHNNHLPGNAFEALVGAIYLDRGYGYCIRFVEKQILKSLVNIDKLAYREENFKSKVLEWTQKYHLQADFASAGETKGDGPTPIFHTRLLIEGIPCGEGSGYSKKESHQRAARMALGRLKKENDLKQSVFDAQARRLQAEAAQHSEPQDTPEEQDKK